MTIAIDLPEDIVASLLAQARMEGRPAAELAAQIIVDWLVNIDRKRKASWDESCAHLHADVQQWPKMAQVVNEVAAKLQPQYGEEGIPSDVLKREIEQLGDYGWDSVIPSDYCYNVINKAAFSFQHWVLVRVKRGKYKYVGPSYAYTGPILWKPKQEEERQIGSWSNGNYRLEIDPRTL